MAGKSAQRIKLTLTRDENPSPLDIYAFPEDIRYFVVCNCKKKCEIAMYMADGGKHFIDNSPENLKLLGVVKEKSNGTGNEG